MPQCQLVELKPLESLKGETSKTAYAWDNPRISSIMFNSHLKDIVSNN